MSRQNCHGSIAMNDQYKPLFIALAIFPFAALAGFGMLLGSREPVRARQVISASLVSGLFAVVVWWITNDTFGDQHLGTVAGLSGLSGFGANSIIGGLLKIMPTAYARLLGLPTPPNDDKKNDDRNA